MDALEVVGVFEEEPIKRAITTINRYFGSDIELSTPGGGVQSTRVFTGFNRTLTSETNTINGCRFHWTQRRIDAIDLSQIANDVDHDKKQSFFGRVFFRIGYYWRYGKSIKRHHESLVLFRLVEALCSPPCQAPFLPSDRGWRYLLQSSVKDNFGRFSKMRKFISECSAFLSSELLALSLSLTANSKPSPQTDSAASEALVLARHSVINPPSSSGQSQSQGAKIIKQQLEEWRKLINERMQRCANIDARSRQQCLETAMNDFIAEYKQLARQIHPDKSNCSSITEGEANELMQCLNQLRDELRSKLETMAQENNFQEVLNAFKARGEELDQATQLMREENQRLREEMKQKRTTHLVELKKRDAALQQKEAALQQKDTALQQKDTALQQQEAEIAALKKQLESLQKAGLFKPGLPHEQDQGHTLGWTP